MNEIKNLVFVVLGSFIIAYATVAFLNPNSMVTGGGVGIAQLLYTYTKLFTLGSWIAIVSIPLILLAWVYFGRAYLIKTLLCIVLIAFFADLLKEVFGISPLTQETILASIFGGLVMGLGVGIIILSRSSAGGTTAIAEIIAMKSKYKTSEILLFIDALIMFSSIFVYGDIEKSLYSVMSVYVTSRIIDVLLSGKPTQKAINIVSNNPKVLCEQIYKNLGQYGTILKGTDLQETHSKTIILVVVDISKIQLLKELIDKYDPEAFLVVKEASEFKGRNYKL